MCGVCDLFFLASSLSHFRLGLPALVYEIPGDLRALLGWGAEFREGSSVGM